MTARSKAEAVRTAGERLEAIEAWSRRTFVAAAATAAFLAVLTCLALYIGADYVRMKWAMQSAADSFARDVARLPPPPALTRPDGNPPAAGLAGRRGDH